MHLKLVSLIIGFQQISFRFQMRNPKKTTLFSYFFLEGELWWERRVPVILERLSEKACDWFPYQFYLHEEERKIKRLMSIQFINHRNFNLYAEHHFGFFSFIQCFKIPFDVYILSICFCICTIHIICRYLNICSMDAHFEMC